MEIARRTFLKSAGALGLLALIPQRALSAVFASAPAPGHAGRFLNAHELDTLRAVCGRFIPGPPEDPDPGAAEAMVPEAIDMLLGAFTFDPPLIHAGAPYSNRPPPNGHDSFADFVPLDRHAELGWRIRIEGTKGIKAREFAGPVVGLQQIYRSGIAHLDARAAPAKFVDLPAPLQDVILADLTDSDVQTFVGAALANTFEAMYGPPEYGGNKGLAGWKYTNWPGDVQPAGYTNDQVSKPDPGGTRLSVASAKAIEKFLPALGGRAAPRDAWWLGRASIVRS